MTELRYLPDADDVTTFTATVTEASRDAVVLDGTYFYPAGGGQPADHGVLEWDGGIADVTDVRKDHGDVRHDVDLREGEPPAEGTTIEARIDEDRRRSLSRMHTAEHVVARVVLDEYGANVIDSRMTPDRTRIEFEPASFDEADLELIERRCNDVVDQDLPVVKENRPRSTVEEEIDEALDVLDAIPDSVDPLRVVEIEGFDVCPCGGTHVSSLGDLGEITITDTTSKGEDVERLEFELSDATQ